ncbi:hypothetical protein AMJ57_00005, partial [Parcubacteria bacterium SG8_24]
MMTDPAITRHRPAGAARRRGLALISAAVMVTVIFALGVSLISYMLSSRRAAKFFETDVNTLQYAEAGIQKALYCLNAESGVNCGGTYGDDYAGETNVPFGDGQFTVTLTGSGSDRQVTSTGRSADGQKTTLKVALIKMSAPYLDTYFDYAMMVTNYLIINNNAAIIDGPIYSEVSVECGGQADIRHDVIVALQDGRINQCTIAGDGFADRIQRSTVAGNCFYDYSLYLSTCGGYALSGRPTPSRQDLPTFDIAYWRQQAESGGIIEGNYSPTAGERMGPIRINGNLTLGNGIDIIMDGPIWVVGNITAGENATITLDASFGQYGSVLLADAPGQENFKGTVNLDSNVAINGSGEEGSWVLVVSTSNISPSIYIKNNATGVLYYALGSGYIMLEQNAGATAVAGSGIVMANNSV